MKLSPDPRLPTNIDPALRTRWYELWRELSRTINTGVYWDGEDTSIPSSGTWAQGDKVKNSSPTEAGSSGSKYIVTGWCCVSSGSPGTWKEMRVLTGG